jgi:hypothetical protein
VWQVNKNINFKDFLRILWNTQIAIFMRTFRQAIICLVKIQTLQLFKISIKVKIFSCNRVIISREIWECLNNKNNIKVYNNESFNYYTLTSIIYTIRYIFYNIF